MNTFDKPKQMPKHLFLTVFRFINSELDSESHHIMNEILIFIRMTKWIHSKNLNKCFHICLGFSILIKYYLFTSRSNSSIGFPAGTIGRTISSTSIIVSIIAGFPEALALLNASLNSCSEVALNPWIP